jgi:hypothetical protein
MVGASARCETFDRVFKRSLIHVDGPPGGGKTAFIEAVLADGGPYEGSFVAMRTRHDQSAVKPRVCTVDDAAVSPELHRYRAAGAMEAMEYHFDEPNTDDFFTSDVGQEPWDVALIEGDDPTGLPDLTVHVLPASAGPVLQRRRFDNEPARLAGLLADRGVPKDVIGGLLAAGNVAVGPQRSRPPAAEHWAITDEHSGLGRAQLVIVNVRGDDERGRAEALLADVARLRGDPEVFADLRPSLIGGRIRITATAADLSNAKDPGTRKALARIRRAIPSIE